MKAKQFFVAVATFVSVIAIAKSATMTVADMVPGHSSHDHQKIEVPQGQAIPTVDVVVLKDAKRGWNLQAKVSNFKFAPGKVNTATVPGEGHADLSINGKQITRLYSYWHYLGNFQPGENRIKVSLNANNHANWTSNSKVIEETEIVKIPEAANKNY